MSKKAFITLLKGRVSFLAVLLSLVALPVGGICADNEKVPLTKEFVAAMESRIPGIMDRYDVPGLIIGLIRDGKLVWKEAFGYADLVSCTPMTTESVCRMESLSKSVTAVGVMKLASEGLIDLDSPVINYLHSWKFPSSHFPVEKITWRMLLSNTSGLPLGTIGVKYSPAEERPGLRDALTKEAVLARMPGTEFEYSNTGFNLLELLIEEVTNRDFSMYMTDEVLSPLGMLNSGFRCKYSFANQVPTGYDVKGSPIPLYVYSEKGAGGLFSTLDDYARFLIAGMQTDSLFANDIICQPEREKMYQEKTKIGGLYGLAFPGYGFGHFIEPVSHGETAVSHGGQGSGWMTHFHAVPERGDAIIIFCNSQRSWPLFANILQVWGEWNGYGRIGMSRILPATKVLWICNVLMALVALWLTGKVIYGILRGNRTFSPFPSRYCKARIVTGISGLILAGGWLIAALQDYLFITAVFPIAAVWLGYGVLFLSMSFFACFLFPKSYVQKNL